MKSDFAIDSEKEALIRQAIASGRLHTPEEAAREAWELWAERERRRAEILAAVDEAEASLARGEGCRITTREEMAQFVDEIKQRGIARLNAEQNTVR